MTKGAKQRRGVMSDSSWRRHANPWSVYTRLAAIPIGALAVWSRVWIGPWSLILVVAVIVWLFLNVRVFKPIDEPRSWVSRGIYGERMWLEGARWRFQQVHRAMIAVGAAGMLGLAWGLYALEPFLVWITVVLVSASQLLRLALLSKLYDASPSSVSPHKPGS